MTHTRIIGRSSAAQEESADDSSSALVLKSTGRFLPSGTRLHEFEIIDVVAVGGFGIVYRALDHSLDRKVAVKEYMPASLAQRLDGVTVSAIPDHGVDTFQVGLQSFVNEARLLAHFDHPALLKVFRFWEANGTAYMAMPLLEGKTLQATLAETDRLPDEAWLKNMLAHVLDALEILHKAQCFHRDIAPDNILILPDGKPLLLDFGAARRLIGDRTQALTVILKPGYAPPEQYADAQHIRQGAWTDIYAMAGVLHFVMTGKAPVSSITRMMSDTQMKLVELKPHGFSVGLLAAVDGALLLVPQDRPQSVAEWRPLLGLHTNTDVSASTGPVPNPQLAPGPTTVVQPLVATTSVGSDRTRRLGKGLASLGLVVFLVYMGWMARSQQVLPKQEAVATLSNKPKELAATNETPPITVFEPLKQLERVFDEREPTWGVRVSAEKNIVGIGRDKLRFRLSSERSGYVYVLMVGTNQSDFSLIFPNEIDTNNHIQAQSELKLPTTGWSMMADGPAGSDEFLVIVSDRPRNFSASGMEAVSPFAQFNQDRALTALKQASGGRSPFSGTAVCGDLTNCSQTYGAATLSIREVP